MISSFIWSSGRRKSPDKLSASQALAKVAVAVCVLLGGLVSLQALVFPLAAFAAEKNNAPTISPVTEIKIQNLTWKDKPQLLKSKRKKDGLFDYKVLLKGRLPHKGDVSLIFEKSTAVVLSGNGDFTLKVPIDSEETDFELIAVNAYGEIQKQEFILKVPQYTPLTERDRAELENGFWKAVKYQVGVGYSSISHSDPAIEAYSQTAMTVKLSALRPFKDSRWELGANAFFTALPLSKSENITARYLGANLRLGYHLSNTPKSWDIGLYAGVYYTTMLVTENFFGYKDLNGPQLFPVIKKNIGQNQLIAGYFKFSSITSGYSLLSFSNREIAGGVSYAWNTNSSHPVSLSLDIADLRIYLLEEPYHTQSTSLGISVGF